MIETNQLSLNLYEISKLIFLFQNKIDYDLKKI